jgi:predicted RNase H-like HicB family nuclease
MTWMKYTIILRRERRGFSAQCLQVPAAISQGETKAEALKNAREALELALEDMREEALQDGASLEQIEVDA